VQHADGHYVAVSRSGEIGVVDEHGRERERYKVPYGAVITVKDGDPVKAGQLVANWDPHTHPVITEMAGRVKLADFVEGVNVQRQVDELTGLTSWVVTEAKHRGAGSKDLRPVVMLVDEDGKQLNFQGTDIPVMYYLPAGAVVNVNDGDAVGIGDVIARIPQETSKTRDITGGLPRVADLFEARKPKEPAILAEISGTVSFGKETKDKQRLIINGPDGEVHPPSAGRQRAGPLRGQRGAGRLSPAGREDQRQAHRGHRPPDAAQGGSAQPRRHQAARR